MTKFKKMSRQNQKLLHWLIDCYAFHLASVDITNKRASEKIKLKGKPYWDFKAKEDLKKIFLRAKGDGFKDYKLSDRLKKRVYDGVSFVEGKHIPSDNKAQLLFEDLEEFVVTEFQNISMILEGTFSLALKLMSNDNAIAFTEFLYEFFIDNSIPMWLEIEELFKKDNWRKYVYMHFKHNQCLICKQYADNVHHVYKVARAGGRKHDKYYHERMPLCSRHHSEVESIGELTFNKKYHLQGGIELTEEEYNSIKHKYKGHFKEAEQNYKKDKEQENE